MFNNFDFKNNRNINDKNKLNEIYLEQQRINNIKANIMLDYKMKAQAKRMKEHKDQELNINITHISNLITKNNELLIKKNIVDKQLIEENENCDDNNYLNMLQPFFKIYDTTNISNPKMEYRYFCFRYLKYIRNIEVKNIQLNQGKEAVLIEFRIFPHIEFLIRNTINKLDEEWSHTIICGNINYQFVRKICNEISPNIKVIKLNIDNMSQSEYSDYLCTLNFWNLLYGEKILIYQEDTCIFKTNINDFMDWDYIGAPWKNTQNDTLNCVGNGGFSLRTKKCMIDVINTISLNDTLFNSSTINYMKNVGLTKGPEDVYFSKNIQELGLGKVADYMSASLFSSESVYNKNSLGGHNFWLSNKKWKNTLYDNIVIQFKPSYGNTILEHRGGWKSVLENLISNDIYNSYSKIDLFDILETKFLWNTEFICNNKWCGIIHCTPKTPTYLDCININNLFKNINFINSLKKCTFIISLSNYVTKFLKNIFKLNKFNINIYTLNHPVEKTNIKLFDFSKFKSNKNKILIQIGQQMRKMTSIYIVKINNSYKKLWLTGTLNFTKCSELLNKEIKYLGLNSNSFDPVKMYYTKTFEEYDNFLENNIVFIDLFDAAANNTILECIVRNTPIIVNRCEGVVEYLGEDYPLYFSNLYEVNELLSYPNIMKAHEYLKNLNGDSFDTFSKNFINIVNKNGS
jgi:hypothetical protein